MAMRKKTVSTEQNFYNQNTFRDEMQSPFYEKDKQMIKNNKNSWDFMHNSSFDYEKFSDDEEEK